MVKTLNFKGKLNILVTAFSCTGGVNVPDFLGEADLFSINYETDFDD